MEKGSPKSQNEDIQSVEKVSSAQRCNYKLLKEPTYSFYSRVTLNASFCIIFSEM